MINNIQIIFTSLRLLRSAKFLLATQGICHHTGRVNASVEQLTSSIKKEEKKQGGEGSGPSIKTTNLWLSFLFFKVGNLG